MQYLAHNGVSHATSVEAVGHSIGQILLIISLVSLAVVSTMIASLWLLRRFSLIEIPSKEKEIE